MERIYIEYDMAKFTRKDITLVDIELYDGRSFQNLEPRRLFPVSGLEKYITLLDETGVEKAIIRDLRTLPPEERKTIESCLDEYYLIPKIDRIFDFAERFDGITLHTDTDRGYARIEIRVLHHGLKLVQNCRVLVRDMNDNRYEIPDINKLDKKSRQILARYV